jgi:four helix bundle protein
LTVWQIAKRLVVETYKLTRKFPSEEKFGLVSQIKRAAISVASNIAEGSSRSSYKDQAHFSQLAYGSLMEIACQFELAKELGFIGEEAWQNIYVELETPANKLSALRKSWIRRHQS